MALAVLFDVSLIDRFGADFEDFLPGMFFRAEFNYKYRSSKVKYHI